MVLHGINNHTSPYPKRQQDQAAEQQTCHQSEYAPYHVASLYGRGLIMQENTHMLLTCKRRQEVLEY